MSQLSDGLRSIFSDPWPIVPGYWSSTMALRTGGTVQFDALGYMEEYCNKMYNEGFKLSGYHNIICIMYVITQWARIRNKCITVKVAQYFSQVQITIGMYIVHICPLSNLRRIIKHWCTRTVYSLHLQSRYTFFSIPSPLCIVCINSVCPMFSPSTASNFHTGTVIKVFIGIVPRRRVDIIAQHSMLPPWLSFLCFLYVTLYRTYNIHIPI